MPVDDYSANTDTSAFVTLGGSQTGTVETGGDQDWFKVNLVAGRAYCFELEGADTQKGTLAGATLSLYDAAGNLLWQDTAGGAGRNALLRYLASASGTYYLGAAGADGGLSGTYKISAREVADDLPAGTSTTGSVSLGGSATGALEAAGDRDWFRVSLAAGTAYTITLDQPDLSGGTITLSQLDLYDSNGKLLAEDFGGGAGTTSVLRFQATASGVYYLAAAAHENQGAGLYRVSLSELAGDDLPVNSTGTSGAIAALGGTATGTLEARGDNDWFAVSLVGGQTYEFALKGAASGVGSLADTWLTLKGSSGSTIAQTRINGDGHESQIVYHATGGGTYFLVVAGNSFDAYGKGDQGTYQLTSNIYGVADDRGDSLQAAGSLTLGEAGTGVIEARGDQECFTINLEAGKRYEFTLSGDGSSQEALYRPVLYLLNPGSGNALAWDSSGGDGRDALFQTSVTAAGTYYLLAKGDGPSTGAYSVMVTEVADDFSADTATTGAVNIGGDTAGVLEQAGDRDWFKVHLDSGVAYVFDVKGTGGGGGSLEHSLISLFDAQGQPAVYYPGSDFQVMDAYSSGEGGDARLVYLNESEGDYFLQVHTEGDLDEGSYTISAQVVSDDFGASPTDALGTLAVGGSASGRHDFEYDEDWFQISLEAGVAYRFTTDYLPGESWASDGWTMLLVTKPGGNGNYIGSDYGGGAGANPSLTLMPSSSGDYYVASWGYTPGSYQITATQLTDDYAGNSGTTGSLATGQTRTGVFEAKYDEDFFKVSLAAGVSYYFDFKVQRLDSTSFYPEYAMALSGPEGVGTQVAMGYGPQPSARLAFQPSVAGVYFLDLMGDGGEGSYQVSVGTLTDDRAAATNTTGGLASPGTSGAAVSVTGKHEAIGDQDWFKVTLAGGRTYQFDLEGVATGKGTLADPDLLLFNSAGSQMASDGDAGSGTNARLVFTPTANGVYYLAASGEHGSDVWDGAPVGDPLGSYTLSARTVVDGSNGTATAQTLALSSPVSGAFDWSGDQDWFKVSLSPGGVYQIDLKGADSGLGTASDLRLEAYYYNSSGAASASYRDPFRAGIGQDSMLIVTPGSYNGGWWYIVASGVEAGTYSVGVTPYANPGDLAANTSTQGDLVAGVVEYSKFDYTGDKDWYALSLEAGNLYKFELTGANGANYIDLYDAGGGQNNLWSARDLRGSSGEGFDSYFYYLATASGTYYLAASSNSAYGLHQIGFSVSSDDLLPSDTTTTAELTVGLAQTGCSEYSGDSDWFKVYLTGGTLYQIDLEGASAGKGTATSGGFQINSLEEWSYAGSDWNGGFGRGSQYVFAPQVDGYYFIDVMAYPNSTPTATYTLTVSETSRSADDFAGDSSTTGGLTLGGSATGLISDEGDTDWFQVSLAAGQSYAFTMQGAYSDQGSQNGTFLHLYDDDGQTPIKYEQGSLNGLDTRLVYHAVESGIYYLSAEACRTWGHSAQGTYQVSFAALNDEYQATSATAGALAVGQAVGGYLETEGDRDWFKISLAAGHNYDFQLQTGWSPLGGVTNTSLVLYGGNSVIIDGTPGGGTTQISYTAAVNGYYYLSAGAEGDNAWGGYVLSAEDVDHPLADDFAGDNTSSGTLGAGGTVTGRLDDSSDSDWFAVSLTSGQTYRFWLESDLSKLDEGYIDLWPADGANNWWHLGSDNPVSFVNATQDGVVWLEVQGGTDKGAFGYTLRSEAADNNFGTTTAAALNVGVATTGDAAFWGDEDWYRVTLTGGRVYQMDVRGKDTGHGTSDGFTLGLYPAGSAYSYGWSDGGGEGHDAQLTYTVTATGVYYLNASADQSGTYQVLVSDITGVDDYAQSTLTSGGLSVGGSITGVINHSSDQDWFRVTLEAGRPYQFDLEGAGSDQLSLIYQNLYLYSPSGSQIANNQGGGDGGDARIVYTPTTVSGVYFLGVTGGGEGYPASYRLRASDYEYVDDYDYSPTGNPGGTLGVLDTPTAGNPADITAGFDYGRDKDWFELSLDAGVTYRFDLEASLSSKGSAVYMKLALTDVGQSFEISDMGSGAIRDCLLYYTPEHNGVFHLRADNISDNSGSYTLTASLVEDDYGDSLESSFALETPTDAAGTSIGGAIQWGSDKDWFLVTLSPEVLYEFEVQGAGSGAASLPTLDYMLYTWDESEESYLPWSVGQAIDSGEGASCSFVYMTGDDGHGALMYLEVGGGTGDYQLTARLSDLAGEPAGSMALGQTATGSLDYVTDNDWYQVRLVAGTAYRFQLDGVSAGAGTLLLPALKLYDGSYELQAGELTAPGSQGGSASLGFTAQGTGDYNLYVGGWANSYGTYRLGMSTAADDRAGGTNTTGVLAVGGGLTGSLETVNDSDWYKVSLLGGKLYQFDLEGASTGKGTLVEAGALSLRDGQGNALAMDGWLSGVGNNSRLTYAPTVSGMYYLSADAGQELGTYRVSAALITDDFAAGSATTGSVSVGGAVTGSIQAQGDRDWFKVSLAGGTAYRFDLAGLSSGAGTLEYTRLLVHDGGGNVLVNTGGQGAGTDSTALFVPGASGVYYLGAAEGSDSYLGAYRLSASLADQFAGDTGTAGSLSVGSQVTGALETGSDADWLRVSLVAGSSYRFDLLGAATGDGSMERGTLSLYDGQGNAIYYGSSLSPQTMSDTGGGEGGNAVLYFSATATGVYHLGVSSPSGGGSYLLGGAELADDLAGGVLTSGTVGVGEAATGSIDAIFDADWFAVELTAGQGYLFKGQGYASGEGTLGMPTLRLHDGSGAELSQAYDYFSGPGFDSEFGYMVGQTGTYYLAVGGQYGNYYSQAQLPTGTYKVSVETVADDFAGGSNTSGALPVGGAAAGDIEVVNDRDWFAVDLSAGGQYRFTVVGDDAGQITGLALYGPDGETLLGGVQGNADGLASALGYAASATGVYYVSVGGWPAGGYEVSAEEVSDEDDFGQASDTAGTVSLGGFVTGAIGVIGDVDWLAVSLSAGVSYQFDLEGAATGRGALVGTALVLHDETGAEKGSDQGGGEGHNSRLGYVPTASGWYYLEARGTDGGSGSYRLGVRVGDDVVGTTDTGHALSLGQAQSGTLESRGDRDWFAVELVGGWKYQFDLTGAGGGGGTLANPYLYLHDASGALLGQADDGGPGQDSRLLYTAAASGVYYLAAGAFGDAFAGTYDIQAALVDVPGGSATGYSLSVTTWAAPGAGWQTSLIESGADHDWYKVSLTAGQDYYFTAQVSSSGLEEIDLAIRNAAGVAQGGVSYPGESGHNFRDLTFRPSVSGFYYLDVLPTVDSDPPDYYTVRALQDQAGGTATAYSHALGATTTGAVQTPGDSDWYRISLAVGGEYIFEVSGQAYDDWLTLGAPLLNLRGANGALQAGANLTRVSGSQVAFAPTTAGVYYLEATAATDTTPGAYALGSSLDVAGGTTSTATLSLGVALTGAMDFAGDRDWYKVSLVGGNTYQFEAAPLAGGDQLDDAQVAIYSSKGVAQTTGVTVTGSSLVIGLAATGGGVYYLGVSGGADPTGTYELSGAVHDYPDNSRTSGALVVGDAAGATSTIGEGDAGDWFKVSLAAGRSYYFDLVGAEGSGGTLADPLLTLYGATGAQVSSNDDWRADKTDSRIFFTAATAGFYYLGASSAATDGAGTYTLRATQEDFGNGSAGSGTLAVGASRSGEIEAASDSDWFKINLVAGTEYWFHLEGQDNGHGALSDGWLRLLAPNLTAAGTPGASDMVFRATAAGAYYLVAGTAASDSVGGYKLSAAVDQGAGTWSAGSLAVGSQTTGALQTGADQDWFKISLVAGNEYRFDLTGGGGAGELSAPVLDLRNASGGALGGLTTDDQATSYGLVYTPTVSAFYWLAASSEGGASGAYGLSAVVGDQPGSTATAAWLVAGGAAVEAEINPGGDKDWFKVSLLAANEYFFVMDGGDGGGGELTDPALRLLKTPTTVVGEGESGDNDSLLNYRAATAGVYYLEAGAVGGGSTGGYAVSVIRDDFSAGSLTTGSLVLGGAAVSGNLQVAGEADWFKASLTRGYDYYFTAVGGGGAGELGDPFLDVFTAAGASLANHGDALVYTAAATGLAYLGVSSAGGLGTGAYAARVVKDDFWGDAATTYGSTGTGLLSLTGTGLSGNVQFTGDEDWFRVSLAAGSSYYFLASGLAGAADQLTTPFLEVLSFADGNPVAGVNLQYDNTHAGVVLNPGAGQGGWYYLSVAGGADSLGAYNLRTYQDQAEGTATTGFLGVGKTVTGSLQAMDDEDWFKVSLSGGGRDYYFELTTNGNFDGYLDIRDTTSNPPAGFKGEGVALGDDGKDCGFQWQGIDNSGVFYITVRDRDNDGIGDYSLRLVEDVGGRPTTATYLPMNTTFSGAIEIKGDNDMFKVSLVAGNEYYFNLSGSGPNALADPLLAVYPATADGPEDVQVDGVVYGGDSDLTFTVPGTAGTSAVYYLLANADGADSRGGYTLSAVMDQTASTRTTGSLSIGGVAVSGNIQTTGDRDWFKVNLVAGRDYYCLLDTDENFDGSLRLLNAQGQAQAFLAGPDLGDDYAAMYYRLPGGTFYLEASSADGGLGSYQVRIVEDVGSTTATAGSLALGATISGSIQVGQDIDLFKVNLVAGRDYYCLLDTDENFDGQLRLLNAQGQAQAFLAGPDLGDDYAAMYYRLPGGTFYLEASSADGGIGSYQVRVIEDVGSTTATAGSLALGATISGSIQVGQDSDFFKLTLVAGNEYYFDMSGSGDSPLGDPQLQIYTVPAGGAPAVPAGVVNGADGSDLTFSAPGTAGASAVYYLVANAQAESSLGGYTLTALVDQPGNTRTASTLAVGAPATGNIQTAGDRDWFRVTLSAGLEYWFDLEGVDTAQGTLSDPFLRLYNSAGALVGSADDGGAGDNSQLSFLATANGTYYLGVAADGDGETGTYRLRAGFGDDLQAKDKTTTGSLTLGESLLSDVNYNGDRDWFGVSLVGGYEYYFQAQGGDGGAGTLGDPILYIYSATGSQLKTDNDGGEGRDALLAYAPGANGVFYVGVGANGDNAIGSYQVSFTRDDYLAKAGTVGTGALSVGGQADGVIQSATDKDWFRVSLTAGNNYYFDLQGADSGHGSLADPCLYLYNSSGSQVGYSNTGGAGLEARLAYTVVTSGLYYVGAAGNTGSTGSYAVGVTMDDYLGATGTKGALTVPTDSTHVSVAGGVEVAGDRDWFKVVMAAGFTYHFDLYGDSGDALADPYLRLRNSKGVLISEDDNGGGGANAHLDYDCTTSGVYYLEASASADAGTGGYILEGWDPPTPGYVPAEDAGLSETLASTLSQVESAGALALQEVLAAAAAQEAGQAGADAVAVGQAEEGGAVAGDGQGGAESPAAPAEPEGAPAAAGDQAGVSLMAADSQSLTQSLAGAGPAGGLLAAVS